jgi:hypothetical protein
MLGDITASKWLRGEVVESSILPVAVRRWVFLGPPLERMEDIV